MKMENKNFDALLFDDFKVWTTKTKEKLKSWQNAYAMSDDKMHNLSKNIKYVAFYMFKCCKSERSFNNSEQPKYLWEC